MKLRILILIIIIGVFYQTNTGLGIFDLDQKVMYCDPAKGNICSIER